MGRLVDADALLAEYDRVHVGPPGGARKLIEDAPTVEPNVTLGALLDLIDYNRESTTERIQICRPGCSWNEYDEVGTASPLLEPLLDAEVYEIGSIAESITRVDIDWKSVKKEA